jgi:hypothetical protein
MRVEGADFLQKNAALAEEVRHTFCLSYSGGQYFLIDSSGTKHEPSGSTNKLKEQIGHEVQITGKSSTKTVESTSYGAASSAEVVPVFEVKSVKRIADTCGSSK